jgi:hypothetical protein
VLGSAETLMASQAPIAIFCYRRPDHLRRTLHSLMQCEGFEASPVFVFADGPRNESEQASVKATRVVARELLGSNARYHFNDTNRGLSASVIDGVSTVIEMHGRAIVVEDDLVLNKFFVRFMNEALDRYEDNDNVFQVSGYAFESKEIASLNRSVFLPFTTSWGLATWQRAWQQFDPTARGWELLATNAELRARFNLGGAYDYATMLERQMSGQRDSWAIRWYWSVFLKGGLILFPPMSLVSNTGFDGSGTHGGRVFSRFNQVFDSSAIKYPELPMSALLNQSAVAQAVAALRRQNGGLRARCLEMVRRLFWR